MAHLEDELYFLTTQYSTTKKWPDKKETSYHKNNKT